MTVGMFFAALAFVAAGLVQLQIDKTLPKFPSSSVGQAKFINMFGETLDVDAGGNKFTLEPLKASAEYLDFGERFEVTLRPGVTYPVDPEKGNRTTFAIIKNGAQPGLQQFNDITEKPEQGANAIRFLNGFGAVLNVTNGDTVDSVIPNDVTEYFSVPQGEASFLIVDQTGEKCTYTQKLGFGSSYTLIIPPAFTFGEKCQDGIQQVLDISPNTFHMAWQIPQYFLITAGEVVFSVTGLEFSYSQAPSNMKSVLQAGWLLTVAVGNIIVLIVAEAATLEDQWAEYILFASLLVLVCIIFAFMAYFYTYIDPTKIEAEFAHTEPEDKKKRKSLEMTRKDSDKRSDKQRRSSDSSSDEEGSYQTKI